MCLHLYACHARNEREGEKIIYYRRLCASIFILCLSSEDRHECLIRHVRHRKKYNVSLSFVNLLILKNMMTDPSIEILFMYFSLKKRNWKIIQDDNYDYAIYIYLWFISIRFDQCFWLNKKVNSKYMRTTIILYLLHVEHRSWLYQTRHTVVS